MKISPQLLHSAFSPAELLITLNAWRRGLRSFTSVANDTRPSPFPSEAGSTSNTIISIGLVSKGCASKAKNPGFRTAHTCTGREKKKKE